MVVLTAANGTVGADSPFSRRGKRYQKPAAGVFLIARGM